MTNEAPQSTIKTATGQTITVGIGNAFAWSCMEYLAWRHGYTPTDPAVAVVMLGTIFSAFILYARNIADAFKYVFDRFFPVKHDQ